MPALSFDSLTSASQVARMTGLPHQTQQDAVFRHDPRCCPLEPVQMSDWSLASLGWSQPILVEHFAAMEEWGREGSGASGSPTKDC